MSRWFRCLIGRHDWDEFGQCRRNWMHVRTEPGDTWRAVAHLFRGTDFSDGPYARVARRRHDAKLAAGLALQLRLAALGEDVSLELCKDAAFNWPDHGESIIRVVQERRSADPS